MIWRVRVIVNELGVPAVVQVLGDSLMKVQTLAANLVARMAKHDPVAQEDFARENAIRPLVTLLSFDMAVDEQLGKQSIHSIVQINKELGKKSSDGPGGNRKFANSYSNSYFYMEGSSRGGNHRKERENEDPAVKLQLKISCAEALWMLARESVSNSRKITETKGMLCLAKMIEKEQGELQLNCLLAMMEITAATESNADLRRAAFKTNSPAAKAVVEQLLRIIKEVDNPSLQIPAIKSIGSLATTFPARETRVIEPLVARLGNRNTDVADAAAIALTKFASPDNFLYVEHSKTIIEYNAVPAVMRLLRSNEVTQMHHGLTLLCYLALHAGNSESLEQARVLTALEGADRSVLPQHIRELVSTAIVHLNLYHTGRNSQRMSFLP
ncbi:Armadillo-type fold [Sesbania bispinosa]|nr:Armadillo-type fold [Sesbania bispinosa]